MTTFLDIQTRVQTRVIDLPAAVLAEVPDLINEALRELQEQHNFYVMKDTASFTTTELVRTLGTIPTDWKEWRGKPYRKEAEGRIYRLIVATNIREAEALYGTSTDYDFGSPEALAFDDEAEAGTGNILIYPYPDGYSLYPDGEYRIEVPYFKYLTELSADGDTNWFLNQSSTKQFLINRATARAFEVNWDEARAQYWNKLADMEYQKALSTDKRRWLSGGASMVPHLDADEPMLKQ